MEGLQRNQLLSETNYLLTGYIGSESFLRSVKQDVIQRILLKKEENKQQQQNFQYLCDPVLGDNGKFYVPEELVDIYRNEIIPLANIVTPNQFELEKLTSRETNNNTIHTLSDAKRACDILHDLGPSLVFVTSLQLNEDTMDSKKEEEKLTILASYRKELLKTDEGENNDNKKEKKYQHEMWRIDSPKINGRFTGTGDLCAALLLAWVDKHNIMNPSSIRSTNNDDNVSTQLDLGLVMEKVVGTMYSVISRTKECAAAAASTSTTANNGVDVHNWDAKSHELKLIQSKLDIESPKQLFKAEKVRV